MENNINMRKKVLIFSIAYFPFVGGAEIAVKEITDRLNKDWYMITCSLGKHLPSKEKIGAIMVHRINCPKLLFPFCAFWLARKLDKKEKFDISWSIMTYAGFAGLFFKIFCPRVKFLLTLQEGTPLSSIKRKSFFVYPLLCLMFKKADKIQAISEFLASFGRDMGHKKTVEVIPNGVDIDIFSKIYSEEDKKQLREKFGKKDNEVFLVTASRLVKKNAVDDIISSLIYLPENISLLVIGKGEEGFNLQKQAENLNVNHRVKFLGFIEQNKLSKYFSICDIFVRPSRSEGFGNSFIEAMASRLPVIATPVGGIVDFIDDKETGIFCSPDNPKSLAQSVRFLLNDKQITEHIKSSAYDRVVQKYSWSNIADQMEQKIFSRI